MPPFDAPCRENVFALFLGQVRGSPTQLGPSRLKSAWSPAHTLRLQTIEQSRLQVFRHAAVDGPMAAIIRPVDKARIALGKERPRLIATAGEAPLFPNLVEPPRVAAVAHHQIFAAHAKPAGNPDVDGIGLRQGTLGAAAG